jgi:hypothetical protein
MNRDYWPWMLAAMTLAPHAHAALINCAELSMNPGDYKVVLDDFGFTSDAAKNDAGLAALKGRLQFNLTGQLDGLRIAAAKLNRSLQVPMRLVFCVGRQPSLSGDEFTDALAERLTDERVIVEVWGTLDLAGVTGTSGRPQAMVGYVMPPVQRYVPSSQVRPIELIAYPKAGLGRSQEELENLPELAAFTLVGLATKASQANQYDLAAWAFTQAKTGIADAKLGGPTADLDALLNYVTRSACQTRNKAHADPTYTGALKLVPVTPCPGAL